MKEIHPNHFVKILVICFILAGLFFTTAQSQSSLQYIDYPDTLILDTHLEKGVGLFLAGAGEMQYKDTSEVKKWGYFKDSAIIYPKNLDSLKVTIISIYFTPFRFYGLSGKKVKQQDNMAKNFQLILSVKGYLGGAEVIIVDQNHNQDLTDDPIRKLHDLDWYDRDGLIRCDYTIRAEGENIPKYGWKNIGYLHGGIWAFTSQYVEAEFSVNSMFYKIGVKDRNGSGFCFFRPQLALLTSDGNMKDTLTQRDYINKGEFVFLDGQTYKFHEFYNGSGTIVLVKEHDYENKIGIQVGLLAPDFNVKTKTGEIVSKGDLMGKPLMIVNLTGCNGPETYQHYEDLFAKFKNTFSIIALEPQISGKLPGILVDTEDAFNKDFYMNYRNAYSSYDCFQISLDGRIKDVFNIYDWEKSMLK